MQAYYYLGLIAAETRHLEEATKELRAAVELNPDFEQARLALALALEESGQIKEAIQEYQSTLKRNPKSADAHNGLGNAYVQNNQIADGITEYRKAVELQPDFFRAYNNLGSTLASVGQFDAGEAAIRKALALRPASFEAHLNMGIILHAKGDPQGGWPDIYVSCDEAPSLLYHTNHDRTFTQIASPAGCAFNGNGATQGGMGAAAGDYDCDGWLDILKPNFAGENVSLYHNNHDGTFYDAVFQVGLAAATGNVGWGAGFQDFDNSGWRDIFISTGHVYPEISGQGLMADYSSPPVVYRNTGNGKFENAALKAGPGALWPHTSRGCAFGDYDNDGDVDVIVINMNEPPSLLRNDCPPLHAWIKVKCLGVKSNRSAIGARVKVVTGNHTQIDEVMSGASYLSQNDFRLHFGLGQAKQVDFLEVRWPSGLVERFENIGANQLVHVQEGQGIVRRQKFSGS